jgi:hypothetical protein
MWVNISTNSGLLRTSGELIVENNEYYYSIGYAEKIGEGEVGIFVSAFDKKNAQIKSTYYYKKLNQWLFTQYRTPIYQIDDNFIFGAVGSKYAYKFSYDPELNELNAIDSVKNESTGGIVLTDMIIRNDTTYYFASLTLPDSNALLLSIKKDNELSTSIYLPQEIGYFYSTSKLAILSDGRIIATGGRKNGTFNFLIYVSELSKEGQLIKETSSLLQDKSFEVADLELVNDSILIIDAVSTYYPYFFNSVYKYNINQRKFLWKYNNDKRPTKFFNHGGEIIKGHKENEFLFCTTVDGIGSKPDSVFNVGQVVKIDDNGKKIWSKDYYRYGGQNMAFNHFATILATSDGNYLIGGETYIQNSEAWLVKIDEDGNIVPIDTSTSSVDVAIPEIKIYPNPTSDYIIINQGEQSDMSYALFDMQGRQLAHIDIENSHTNVVWDLPELQSGSYQMIVTQKGIKVMDKKIVVVR